MARILHVLLCIFLLTSYTLKAECKTSFHSREDNLANNDGTVEFYVEETNTNDVETREPFTVEDTEEDTDAINRENMKPFYVEDTDDIIEEETVTINAERTDNDRDIDVNEPPTTHTGAKEAYDAIGQHKKDILNVPFWSNLLLYLIQSFSGQRQDNRSQFGVLFMNNVKNLNTYVVPVFEPKHPNGSPIIDNRNAMSPANRNDFGNYVCTRPERVPKTMIHSEERILQEIDALWSAYKNTNERTPNMIVLYSWIMPCPKCTDLIINHLNRFPYTDVQFRMVGYTVEGTNSSLPYMTPEGNELSRQRLKNHNINVYKQKFYKQK